MRVAIDLLAVRSWGTRNYTAGLLPALGALAPSCTFQVWLRPEIADLVRSLVPANVEIRTLGLGVAPRIVWEQTLLPLLLARWRADVLFAGFDIAPVLAPCPVLLAVRNPSPATIGDAAVPKSLGQHLAGRVHQTLSWLSCRRARLVFYPTAFAAELLGSVMRVPAARRRVVHHGTDREYFAVARPAANALGRYGLESRSYVLYVSGFYPYKHPEVLIEAFHTFANEAAGQRFKLVLVGADLLIAASKRVMEGRLRAQVQALGLSDRVVFTDQVAREDLAALYQNAAAFVLPSVMETFGLPYVEAMASGAPVICADMPFAREICGDAARYFPPGDCHALAELIAGVTTDGDEAGRMAAAGRERSAAFSWPREARGTFDLLLEVAQRSV
jgi:glycosyltransferase involved in cell wall biosynthesis